VLWDLPLQVDVRLRCVEGHGWEVMWQLVGLFHPLEDLGSKHLLFHLHEFQEGAAFPSGFFFRFFLDDFNLVVVFLDLTLHLLGRFDHLADIVYFLHRLFNFFDQAFTFLLNLNLFYFFRRF